jgi:hypothetical protein
MCGRYTITIDKSTIECRFNAKFFAGNTEFTAAYASCAQTTSWQMNLAILVRFWHITSIPGLIVSAAIEG